MLARLLRLHGRAGGPHMMVQGPHGMHEAAEALGGPAGAACKPMRAESTSSHPVCFWSAIIMASAECVWGAREEGIGIRGVCEGQALECLVRGGAPRQRMGRAWGAREEQALECLAQAPTRRMYEGSRYP